jgi:ADP-ribose pyrophosphatase
MTRILDRTTVFATPWFEVVSKHVPTDSQPYYSLRMQDYVSVVAFTKMDQLVLVRQYRPAVERFTLELPSGHIEKNEPPEESARRELAEECGLHAQQIELLGTLLSDCGRHENRLWCYYAPEATAVEHVPETGVETILVPRANIPQLLANPEFDHALNWAALMLALTRHGARLLALK